MGLKKCQLLWCFHTLTDHPVLEAFTHADDRANDDSVVGTGNDIAHERLVHLHGIDGKSSQIAQAGIAGAKVINGQPHTDGFELIKRDIIASTDDAIVVSAVISMG